MTLSFMAPMAFYNEPALFKLQPENDPAFSKAENTMIGLWRTQLQTSIKRYNEGEFTRITQASLLSGLIYATINKYRAERNLKPFIYGGVVTDLMGWQSTQRATKTGLTVVSEIMKRPNHSANLGGIAAPSIESDLFLQQQLEYLNVVGHVTEYMPQEDNMPDYIVTEKLWNDEELMNVTNWPAYAADVVAAIAGTWNGKQFLMQSSDTDLYYGQATTLVGFENLELDLMTASTTPTIL